MTAALLTVIRAEARERGITASALADAAGVHKGTMSRYLNGHREMNMDVLFGISDGLGVDASELVRRTSELVDTRSQ